MVASKTVIANTPIPAMLSGDAPHSPPLAIQRLSLQLRMANSLSRRPRKLHPAMEFLSALQSSRNFNSHLRMLLTCTILFFSYIHRFLLYHTLSRPKFKHYFYYLDLHQHKANHSALPSSFNPSPNSEKTRGVGRAKGHYQS